MKENDRIGLQLIVEMLEKKGAALELLRDSDTALKKIQAKSSDADIREICVAMRERIDDLLSEL